MAKSDVVGAILGKHKARFLNKPAQELVLPDQALGIEIELEKCPVQPNRGIELLPEGIAHYWNSHEDGSLHDNGVEFTFKEPLFGEDIINALTGFFDSAHIKRMKASLRTGIHVHMDARDLSRHQLLGLVAYYIMFEPALYEWVGEGRHANNFCIPWYKYQGSLERAERILVELRRFSIGESDGNDRALTACENFEKYAGLNLKALGTYGSVEFRQLQTVLDYGVVKNWMNILMSLKKAAMDAPESTVTIINEVRRRGIEMSIARIFGEQAADHMIKPHVIKTMTEITIPNALEFIDSVVDPPISNEEIKELEWKSKLESGKKDTHPGVDLWRKTHFPKESGSEKAMPPTEPPNQHVVGGNDVTWHTYTMVTATPGNPLVDRIQEFLNEPQPLLRAYLYDLDPVETKVIMRRPGRVTSLVNVFVGNRSPVVPTRDDFFQYFENIRVGGSAERTPHEEQVHGPTWYYYPRIAAMEENTGRRVYHGVAYGEVYRDLVNGFCRFHPLTMPLEDGISVEMRPIDGQEAIDLLNLNSFDL
jgi:hypothetical protein